MIPQKLFILESILLGLAIGSFLNVCINRIPQQESMGGRSRCPKCKHQIRWFENIPVLSYLALRGKCHSCKTSISFQYPFIELLTAGLSIWTAARVGFIPLAYFLWFCFFICPLIVISAIDFKHRIIPDIISLPGILIGTAVLLILNWPLWQESLIFSGLGFLVGGGSLYAISLSYYLIRKREGMGGGDIKLCAMLGTFLGWKGMIFIFFASSVLALLFAVIALAFQGKQKEPMVIPYGPFLSAAAILYFFYGREILNFYFAGFRH